MYFEYQSANLAGILLACSSVGFLLISSIDWSTLPALGKEYNEMKPIILMFEESPHNIPAGFPNTDDNNTTYSFLPRFVDYQTNISRDCKTLLTQVEQETTDDD